MRWSEDQLRAHQQRQPLPQKPNARFKNIRSTDADGRKHDSKLEFNRWQELQQLEAAGAIRELKHQVSIALTASNGEHIGVYVADATYVDAKTGRKVIEDSKGSGDTPLFRWKARHVKAQYGIEITIIRKARKS